MGGAIAVAFRFPDGKIIAQERWTNPLPFWFFNTKMYKGNIDYINDYISKAENPTPIPVAPLGYGLVLVDLISNHLLSMQSYTEFNERNIVHFINPNNFDAEDQEIWAEILAETRISKRSYTAKLISKNKWGPTSIITQPLSTDIINIDSFICYAKQLWKINYNIKYTDITFVIDTSPLINIRFEESQEGSDAFKTKLVEIGISLTEEDKNAWAIYEKDSYSSNEEE